MFTLRITGAGRKGRTLQLEWTEASVLGPQEQTGKRMHACGGWGAAVTSFVPFHTQGGREDGLGGKVRRCSFWGPLSSTAKGSQHRLPFQGTTQRIPCLGVLAVGSGRTHGRGWGGEGHCLQCCTLAKLCNPPKLRGGDKHLYPLWASCLISLISFTTVIIPLGKGGTGGPPKRLP